MSHIRLFVAVVAALIAGSASTLAQTTCPPGYQPAPVNIQNQQQTGVIYTPPSSSTAPPSGYNTQTLGSGYNTGGAGGGYASGCVPIPKRSTSPTPTGKTTTQTDSNKNRRVPITPTGK